jgi:hypothetical protein
MFHEAMNLLTFLDQHSGSIIAVATVASVFIAGLYTFYTTRLWKVSAQQARSMKAQVEVAQHQLELVKEQMAITGRTFEAVNRPRLLVKAKLSHDGPIIGSSDPRDALTIGVRNYGQSPGTVMACTCSVPEGESSVWIGLDLPVVVPPGDVSFLGRVILPPVPSATEILDAEDLAKDMRWVHVRVTYRGVTGTDYKEQAQVSVLPDAHDKSKWGLFGVTPTGPEFWEVHRLSD